MKNIILGILLLSFWSMDAQTDSTKTTEKEGSIDVNIGGVKIENKDEDGLNIEIFNKDEQKRRVKTRWIMLDLGMNTYFYNNSLNLPASMDAYELNLGKSLNWNLHIFRQRVNLIDNKLNLLWGLGFEWNCYNFVNDYTLTTGEAVQNPVLEANKSFRNNRLQTTMVTMPIMLNFESKPKNSHKSFRLSAGGFAGFMLGSNLKQVDQDKNKTIIRDDFNLNRFRYGVRGEVGIGPINFYATYSANTLFKTGEGPSLNPFNVGLVLIPF